MKVTYICKGGHSHEEVEYIVGADDPPCPVCGESWRKIVFHERQGGNNRRSIMIGDFYDESLGRHFNTPREREKYMAREGLCDMPTYSDYPGKGTSFSFPKRYR